MKNEIHATAIIDSKAKLGTGNYIGPFCVIGPNVVLGSNNRLESHVSIGMAAEHRDFFLKPPGKVLIGNGNVLREFVTINAGTHAETTIEDHCTFLKGSHVGHDAVIRSKVNLGVHTIIGGHSIVGYASNLGLATVVHQYRVIGACAMIGMNSTVTKNIIPFVVAFGTPCNPHRINRIGLERSGVSPNDLSLFEKWFGHFQLQADSISEVDLEHKQFAKFLLDFERDKKILDQTNPHSILKFKVPSTVHSKSRKTQKIKLKRGKLAG